MICLKYVQDMAKIYINDMPKACIRCSLDMLKICPRYAKDMPKRFTR